MLGSPALNLHLFFTFMRYITRFVKYVFASVALTGSFLYHVTVSFTLTLLCTFQTKVSLKKSAFAPNQDQLYQKTEPNATPRWPIMGPLGNTTNATRKNFCSNMNQAMREKTNSLWIVRHE